MEKLSAYEFGYEYFEEHEVDYEGKNVVVYGRGVVALNTIQYLRRKNVDILGFTDTNATNKDFFAGKKCFAVNELKQIPSLIIFLAVGIPKNRRDIFRFLNNIDLGDAIVVGFGPRYVAGLFDVEYMKKLIAKDLTMLDYVRERLCDEESVTTLNNLILYRQTNDSKYLEEAYDTSHKQYFPPSNIMKSQAGEVFVDVGGYDGETTVQFFEWAGENASKSIIFEADEFMCNICSEMMRIKQIENACIINKALYSGKGVLNFESIPGSRAGAISGDGNTLVEGTTGDEELLGEDVTFIKMDIEGAEREALIGLERVIGKCRPKLAISIYHKEDDLWRIPYDLMKKYPFYKFYIRHYTPWCSETVLYAVEK